jgi:hypothetical protein
MNPQAYYTACQVMVASLKVIAENFIRSSFNPDSIPQSGVVSVNGQETNVFTLGMQLYSYIYSSGAAPRYNPVYLNGLYGFLNQGMNGHMLSGEMGDYRIRAKDLNKAHQLMISIMQTEDMLNKYRDPFNMGYPPILTTVNAMVTQQNIALPPYGSASEIEPGLTGALEHKSQ